MSWAPPNRKSAIQGCLKSHALEFEILLPGFSTHEHQTRWTWSQDIGDAKLRRDFWYLKRFARGEAMKFMARIERQEVSNKVHIHCLILITIQWFVRCMKPIASDVTIMRQSYSATNWQQEVCHFQMLWIHHLTFTNLLQTSSEYCKNTADVKLWREYWYLKYCVMATASNLNFLFLVILRLSGHFWGLNMVKNSWKCAHTLEPAAVRTPLRLGPGRGTEALRRPLEHIRKLDV